MNRRTDGWLIVVLLLILSLTLWNIGQSNHIDDLEYRVQELNCVHYIYEDGDAVHVDAEVALECLRRQLGSRWRPEGDRG